MEMTDVPLSFLQFLSHTINSTYPVSFIAIILSFVGWGQRFLLFLRISRQNNAIIETLFDEIHRLK